MRVVAVNVGSSSARLSAFDGERRRDQGLDPGHPERLAGVEAEPEAVVHRIVHGGATRRATCELDAATRTALEAAVPLAPLHLPRALRWVDAARARWPRAIQVAAFDTAFYATLPPAAATYALAPELRAHGIVRYGFHGLAHQSLLRALGPKARAITMQLGAGASMTASCDGRAVDTTMGFSPLEGLVMATRSGDVDPGALLHLLRDGVALAELDRLLEHESGLKGLAGDGDMRALLARDDAEARLALDVYVHRARKHLGALLAVLGGCDAIAVGGGVGENAPPIRAALFANFAWAGIELDPEANAAAQGRPARISTPASRVTVDVVLADEAAVMRDEAERYLSR